MEPITAFLIVSTLPFSLHTLFGNMPASDPASGQAAELPIPFWQICLVVGVVSLLVLAAAAAVLPEDYHITGKDGHDA